MMIEGFEVTYLGDDDKPVKNKLPEELKERFKTEKQWLEQGYKVKEGAIGYEMHSNVMGKRLFMYYLDEQVEELGADEECCATCVIRLNRYCPVAGDYIRMTHKCSEWSD